MLEPVASRENCSTPPCFAFACRTTKRWMRRFSQRASVLRRHQFGG